MGTKIDDAIRFFRTTVADTRDLNDADRNAINHALLALETAIARSGVWPNERSEFIGNDDVARLKTENNALRHALHETVLQVIREAMPRKEGEE